jgi:glycogen(starch) synthase
MFLAVEKARSLGRARLEGSGEGPDGRSEPGSHGVVVPNCTTASAEQVLVEAQCRGAGNLPGKVALESAIRDAGLGAKVHLPGRVSDSELHAWYEAADLFVHPTLYEGSSLVTLEAMAHRRAVVATTAGGLPDKVHPGVSGWLVPPGDASALAAAISGALGEPGRLPAMGIAGRAIVERDFSWEVAGAATLRFYEDLLR